MLCVSTEIPIGAVRFATPCDNKVECIYGRDEQDCETPTWVLPAVLLVAIFFLLCSPFCFVYMYIRREVQEISRNTKLKSQQPLQSISCKQQKRIFIAMLLDQYDKEAIEALMEKEIETHGYEGKAICCFKVNVASLLEKYFDN